MILNLKVRAADTDAYVTGKESDANITWMADLVRPFGHRWSEISMSDQKLYISSARGWRDRDSFLTRCYAIDALEEEHEGDYVALPYKKPVKFVSIDDESAGVRGREWKNVLIDEGDWFYRFANGQDIRRINLEPKPIKIELSFSELVGEE